MLTLFEEFGKNRHTHRQWCSQSCFRNLKLAKFKSISISQHIKIKKICWLKVKWTLSKIIFQKSFQNAHPCIFPIDKDFMTFKLVTECKSQPGGVSNKNVILFVAHKHNKHNLNQISLEREYPCLYGICCIDYYSYLFPINPIRLILNQLEICFFRFKCETL